MVTSVNAGSRWLDLSGIGNRRPWTAADGLADQDHDVLRQAAAWFGCPAWKVRPVAGEPDLARLVARLPAGRAAVLGGHDRYGAPLRQLGWQVRQVEHLSALPGADLAVVANPGDPDGQELGPAALAEVAPRVGHLLVDETLADARPDLSLAPTLPPNALILRSLTYLWGVTGLHFVLGDTRLLADLPPASTEARRRGAQALADRRWTEDAVLYLAEAALRLDRLALGAGWRLAGGTHLFRLYQVPDASAVQDRLARALILPRRCREDHLRLAIPATRDEWDRLAAALQ